MSEAEKHIAEIDRLKQAVAQRDRDLRSLQATLAQRESTIAALNARVEELTGQRNLAGGAAVLAGIGVLSLLGGDE